MSLEVCVIAITAPKPDANNLSKVEPGGAICTGEVPPGLSGISRMLRTKFAPLSPSASTAIFFLRNSSDRLDLLAAGAEQQHHVMIEAGTRARVRRDLGVGTQHRQVGLFAVDLRKRLGAVRIGHDLEIKPRPVVFENSAETLRKARVGAGCIANCKHQRVGIFQPDPAAPNSRNGKDKR